MDTTDTGTDGSTSHVSIPTPTHARTGSGTTTDIDIDIDLTDIDTDDFTALLPLHVQLKQAATQTEPSGADACVQTEHTTNKKVNTQHGRQ